MKTIKTKRIPPSRLGMKVSEESKIRMSIAQKKRFSVPGSHPHLGKTFSEKTKKKMGETKKKMYQSGKYNPRIGKFHSETTKRKMSIIAKQRRGPKTSNWKGGCYKESKRGYIFMLNPYHPFCNNRGYILEHRLIIEKIIKRFLNPSEPAHHINKDKSDNRPENLMAFKSQIAHNSFEAGYKVNPKDIIFDGRSFS